MLTIIGAGYMIASSTDGTLGTNSSSKTMGRASSAAFLISTKISSFTFAFLLLLMCWCDRSVPLLDEMTLA